MSADSRHIVRKFTPEEEELERKRAELAALEEQLADRELELTTLNARLEQFRSRYMSAVGRRYAELDRIEAEIARLIAAKNPSDPHARQEAQERREAAEESAREAGSFEKEPPVDRGRFTPSVDLKNLFRMVAKAMHPDLAASEEDRVRREKAMAAANKAYREGDEQALRRLLAEWEASPDNVMGDDIASRLVRTIRSIHRVRQRLVTIEEETRQLRAAELFKLYEQCEEAETQARDLLREIAKDIDDRIVAAKQRQSELQEQ